MCVFHFLCVIRDVATQRCDFSVSVKLVGFDGIDLKSVFQDTVINQIESKNKTSMRSYTLQAFTRDQRARILESEEGFNSLP